MSTMTFDEMTDRFDRLAAGGLEAGIQQVGEDIGDAMVQQAQVNAMGRLTMRTFELYGSIRFTPTSIPDGVEIALMAGGTEESAHAVYQEEGFTYISAEGEPAVYDGVYYLRDAFEQLHPTVEPALLDFLSMALT